MPASPEDDFAHFREPGALWEETKELHEQILYHEQRLSVDRLSDLSKAMIASRKGDLPPLVPVEIQQLIPDIPYEFLEIGTPRFQILLYTIAAIQAGHISPTEARLTSAEPPGPAPKLEDYQNYHAYLVAYDEHFAKSNRYHHAILDLDKILPLKDELSQEPSLDDYEHYRDYDQAFMEYHAPKTRDRRVGVMWPSVAVSMRVPDLTAE